MPGRRGDGIALLADPTRRRILALIATRPLRPSQIASELELSRPATSRQLRLLQEAGIIRPFRSLLDGRSTIYRINPDAYGPVIAWLAGTDVGRPIRMRVPDLDPSERDARRA